MESSAMQPSSSIGEDEASRVVDHHHPNREAQANKQRRKMQNRKNQRARRLRIKRQDPGSVQTSLPRPFQVSRWRVDELGDEPQPQPHVNRVVALRGPPPTDTPGTTPGDLLGLGTALELTLTPPSRHFNFPLAADHLLHLVQYNVFRAFVSNKRTLNTLLTGWSETDSPRPPSPSSTICPISGPYRDNTMVYPLNPNIPSSLFPTHLQQTRLHTFWINLFPFPTFRDNLIRRDGNFDHWGLLQDLIGELLGGTPFEQRQGIPVAVTVSDPKSISIPAQNLPPPTEAPPTEGSGADEDEVTAGRNGLIVWGEPHDISSWEATPSFLTKWSWAVKGCYDLVDSSNRWRLMRGEEPLCHVE